MLFVSFQRMGQNESKPSGKRFRKGTPIKYVHPLFKKNTTLAVLQSIKRRTRPNNERQVLLKKIEQSKSIELQQRTQLIRYQNLARALVNEINIREAALLKQQQEEREQKQDHKQDHKQDGEHEQDHGQDQDQDQESDNNKEDNAVPKQSKKRRRSNPSVLESSSVLDSFASVASHSFVATAASHSSPAAPPPSSSTSSSSTSSVASFFYKSTPGIASSNTSFNESFGYMIDDVDSAVFHSVPVVVTNDVDTATDDSLEVPNDEFDFDFLLNDITSTSTSNDIDSIHLVDIDIDRVQEHWREINMLYS